MNGDGQSGEKAAAAYKESMNQSDLSYYAGHGRFGSGPDFDRAMAFDYEDEAGQWRHIDDYELLESIMTREGKAHGRDAWSQFQAKLESGKIRPIDSHNANIYMNATANIRASSAPSWSTGT